MKVVLRLPTIIARKVIPVMGRILESNILRGIPKVEIVIKITRQSAKMNAAPKNVAIKERSGMFIIPEIRAPAKKKNSHTATKIKQKDNDLDSEKMGLLIFPTKYNK
jgi:hypothetical protein